MDCHPSIGDHGPVGDLRTAPPVPADGALDWLCCSRSGSPSMFASLLPQGGVNMGDRNVEACRRALGQAQISLVAQDTGGTYGRSVFLHIRDGKVVVRSLAHGEKVL